MLKTHQIVFIAIILILLCIPLSYILGVKDRTEIKGVEYQYKLPSLQDEYWINRQFQADFEKWWNSHFGFRNFFLKTKNSIYDLFNLRKIHSGFNNLLIQTETGHLIDRTCISLLLNDACQVDIQKLGEEFSYFFKQINKMNKRGYVVLGSTKAHLYREQIPERFKYFANPRCDIFEEWEKVLLSNKIPYLNTQKMFGDMLQREGIEAYSKAGTHWNAYAAARVTQDVVKNLDLGVINIDSVEQGKEETLGERDLADLLNTWFPYYPDKSFPHVRLHANRQLGKKIVLIGDSYAGSLYHMLVRSGASLRDELILVSNRLLTDDEAKKIICEADIFIFCSQGTSLNDPISSMLVNLEILLKFLPIDPAKKTIFYFSEEIFPFEIKGISFAEQWGRWTESETINFRIPILTDKDITIYFGGLIAYITEKNRKIDAEVFANGESVAVWEFKYGLPFKKNYAINIKKEILLKSNILDLVIKIKGAVRPCDVGDNASDRLIGLGFHTLSIEYKD